jgi:hypothetical protein
MKASDSQIEQQARKAKSLECAEQGSRRPSMPSAFDAIQGAASSEEAFARLQGWAQSVAAHGGELFDVEREMQKGGFEVLRLLLEEHIRRRGVGDIGPAVVVEKKSAPPREARRNRRARMNSPQEKKGTD